MSPIGAVYELTLSNLMRLSAAEIHGRMRIKNVPVLYIRNKINCILYSREYAKYANSNVVMERKVFDKLIVYYIH